MNAGVAARVAAVRILDAVAHRGRSLKAEFANALPALPDPRDRALVEAIVFAALRNRARYDATLAAWMAKPPGRRDGELRALLWAGLAQLEALGLPRMPRSMPPSPAHANSAARTRPGWSMRCCDARYASPCRKPMRAWLGRAGCRSAFARIGRRMRKRSLPKARRKHHCGCA